MSTCSKKKYILNKVSVSVSLGCSGGCRRPNLSAVFHPRRRHHRRSSSSSWDTTTTTTSSGTIETTTSETESDIRSLRAVHGFGPSVAVEKESDDPYEDFRKSMLQMILEREIYARDDLKDLLNCFLQLNAPYYHGIIVRAFTQIWNGADAAWGPTFN